MELEVFFGFGFVLFFVFGYSGEGSVNFLYFFKERTLKSIDSLYSFIVSILLISVLSFTIFYHGLGLDLVCSCLIKFLSCIIKLLICAGEGILPWLLQTIF